MHPKGDNSRYCFALPGELYLVYLPQGGRVDLDLTITTGAFPIRRFNSREGGALQPAGDVTRRGTVTLQSPTANEDWLAGVANIREKPND